MASSGCCDPAHHGATCPMTSVRTPPATTASFVGGGLASGVGSWTLCGVIAGLGKRIPAQLTRQKFRLGKEKTRSAASGDNPRSGGFTSGDQLYEYLQTHRCIGLTDNRQSAAFVQQLRELGWIEGRTVAIEVRSAENIANAGFKILSCRQVGVPSSLSNQLAWRINDPQGHLAARAAKGRTVRA